jgi:hypothetical protein
MLKKEQVLCIGEKREKFTSLPTCKKPPPCHFVCEEGNASKPLCIGSYKKSMGFVGVNDIINSNLQHFL